MESTTLGAACAAPLRLRALFAAAAASTLVAACSNGGGGGSPPPPPPPPPTPTHQVGGTVSGLTGAGLVVTDNGVDVLAVSANGAFTFTAPVVEAGAYAVAVRTQPTSPAQTCVVSNGSGAVAKADVTSVRIDCSVNTHHVGGTVTGLAGSGLVLRESDGDTLAPSASGTFRFATAKPSGSAYQVSVVTQPANPTQTCSISGATSHGTIADAEVADVAVVCSTNAYSVFATVAGLTGSGLVLQDNGVDDLAAAANGGYGFATPLASGAAYNVTVKTQPANPTQTCSVAGGSGLVGAGNVTDVKLTCATQSFKVRGSVSGLAGSGLVLEDNGADDLAVSVAGSFVFPTGVVSGAPYTVTVRTQPSNPAQTCTAGAGSTGTIGSADATGVAVVCSTNSYAVGGTVQGLAGSGLVLQDNGGDDLAVAADGSFRFPTAVASNGGYAVTVRSAPGTPRQACTVANASGTVLGSDVADVRVTCTTSVARFAFLSEAFDPATSAAGDVTPYAVDPATGALGSPGALVGAGKSNGALAVTPSGQFGYVANGRASNASVATGTVSSYRIDPATGAMSANGPEIATGVGTDALAMHPSGRFVYVANFTDNTIDVFAITPLTGLLTPVQVAAAPSPHSLSIEPSGRFLYVAQTNVPSIGVYAIDASTGKLTHASDTSLGTQPYAVASDPSGHFEFMFTYGSSTSSGGVASYTIDPVTGALAFVNSQSTGISPNGIAVHPSGRFLYVTNLGQYAPGVGFIFTGSISVYSVNTSTGQLTQPLAEIVTGPSGGCLAVDPSGRFAWFQNYTANASRAPRVTPLVVNTSTGALGAGAADLPAAGCVTVW